jgi:hypothetical protein
MSKFRLEPAVLSRSLVIRDSNDMMIALFAFSPSHPDVKEVIEIISKAFAEPEPEPAKPRRARKPRA